MYIPSHPWTADVNCRPGPAAPVVGCGPSSRAVTGSHTNAGCASRNASTTSIVSARVHVQTLYTSRVAK